MYKACKTKESAERQQHIQDCLIRLMCRHLYSEISVCELCTEAQVPRKTFYRYFESKDDVLCAIADHIMDDYESFHGPYAPGDRRTSEKDIEKMFTYWQQHGDLLMSLRRSQMTTWFLERLFRRSCSEHQGFRLMHQANNDHVAQLTTTFTFFGLFALILEWQAQGCHPSPKEMSRVVSHLFTQPLYVRLD